MSSSKKTPPALDSRRERGRGIETRLWRIVVQRALLDALSGKSLRETAEARKWLTGGGGDLRLVAELADLDADMIVTWALWMQADGWPKERAEEYRRRARDHEQRRMAA